MPKKPVFDPPPASETGDYAARSPALLAIPMSPSEFRLACRSRMPTVLSVLDRILADPAGSTTSLIAAAAQLTERSYGKAPVVEEMAGNRSARDMSSEELLAIARAGLEERGIDEDALLARVRRNEKLN